MTFESDHYELVSEETPKWLGPCADSFCYGSCTSPHCKSELRLGKTPAEHNQKLKEMKKAELQACIERLTEAGYAPFSKVD